jgi:hypothetical protein
VTTPSPDASWALASSEEEHAKALARRYGLEYVDVASFAPDPELLKSVPVELMFRYALPGLSNLWVSILKDSSLISVVGFSELLFSRGQLFHLCPINRLQKFLARRKVTI